MDTVTDYLADAPSYTAWAGDGPAANRIIESDDPAAMHAFRATVNDLVGHMVDEGHDIAGALRDYDPEAVARNIVITWHDTCAACDTAVTWEAAAWEPWSTEAPLNGSGLIVCDGCHDAVTQ